MNELIEHLFIYVYIFYYLHLVVGWSVSQHYYINAIEWISTGLGPE